MKSVLIGSSLGGFNLSVRIKKEFIKRKFNVEVIEVLNRFGGGYHFITKDGKTYDEPKYEDYREDPVLIKAVKDVGVYDEECYDYDDVISIEKFDDKLHTYRIEINNRGYEQLVLEPLIRKRKIKQLMGNYKELMDYLKSTGVAIK